MKNIAILGSTGSIGTQTLEVIRRNPDRFQLVALAAGFSISLILDQVQTFKPQMVSVGSEEVAQRIRPHLPDDVRLYSGLEGMMAISTYEPVDTLVTAVVGSIGLRPTLAAIEAGKSIALANKETLVTAGEIVMDHVRKHHVSLLPVDSEHSAILQCLQGEDQKQVEEMILTASGGSFRHKSRKELVNVSVEDALQHPTWSMGSKITIDSATMMNKGFEVIEAHWLFAMPYERIRVLLHEESIIHSLVVYQDSTVMAQLGTPDMKIPIQYALTYPERVHVADNRLNLAEVGKLHFKEMDVERYPCLGLAYEAGRRGGTYPAVLNAANEIAVQRFLNADISFLQIEEVIERTLEEHVPTMNPALVDIEAADGWAREAAESIESR